MEARDKLFFRLLRFALGTETICPKMHLSEWREMFQIAKKQAVSGFIGSTLKNIDGDVLLENDAKNQDAFTDLIMDWMGEVVNVARRNKQVNNDVIEEFRQLESKGLQCCLLKGQGNALMYPEHDSRTSGDIDVWVRFKDSVNTDVNIRQIIKMTRDEQHKSKISYHHIDIPNINNTSVEVHYRPQFLFYYWHNKHLQKFFDEHADEQFNNKVKFDNSEIAVPTAEFNIVFQLSHIYNHLFHEGIGLRQIVDYYYVLKVYANTANNISSNWSVLLSYLGLYDISCAIMWILINAFGMSEEWALVPQDERRGRFVLNEILQGGNFGMYDERNAGLMNSKIGRNIQRLKRDVRLLRYFPSEALSEPLFRLWHAWWRFRHN